MQNSRWIFLCLEVKRKISPLAEALNTKCYWNIFLILHVQQFSICNIFFFGINCHSSFSNKARKIQLRPYHRYSKGIKILRDSLLNVVLQLNVCQRWIWICVPRWLQNWPCISYIPPVFFFKYFFFVKLVLKNIKLPCF